MSPKKGLFSREYIFQPLIFRDMLVFRGVRFRIPPVLGTSPPKGWSFPSLADPQPLGIQLVITWSHTRNDPWIFSSILSKSKNLNINFTFCDRDLLVRFGCANLSGSTVKHYTCNILAGSLRCLFVWHSPAYIDCINLIDLLGHAYCSMFSCIKRTTQKLWPLQNNWQDPFQINPFLSATCSSHWLLEATSKT